MPKNITEYDLLAILVDKLLKLVFLQKNISMPNVKTKLRMISNEKLQFPQHYKFYINYINFKLR
jgi:hypothetical protein